MPLAEQVLGHLDTPINEEIIFQIVDACARALVVAHETGHIHRDLTPRNILKINDENGNRWVVADWGLVRRQGYTSAVRTPQGQTFGTEVFAPPEMWLDAHNATVSADVYSLGRVVAWCLGTPLAPNFPVNVSGAWSEFIASTTNLDAAKRVPSMDIVLLLLENVKLPGKYSIYPGVQSEETKVENFTGYMKRIIEYLWNEGTLREATIQEIRENVGLGAYGNHNKLSLSPWDLLANGNQPRTRRLTGRGLLFAQGVVKIPRRIIKNPITGEWMADPNSPMISITEI